MKLILVLTFLSCQYVYGNAAFESGLMAYNKEDWSGAIQHWESVTASGQTSATLEYNLGNAYFRLGKLEKAILHFERSLRLQPGDEDAIRNLALANRGIVDQIPATPKLGIWKHLNSIRDFFHLETLKIVLIVLNACLAIVVGVLLYAKPNIRDIARRAAVLLVGLSVVVLSLYSWRSSAYADSAAIVMVDKTDVFSSPSDNSTQLFSLHSGTKVSVGETLAAWTEIQLSDGRKGWIVSNHVEII